MMSSATPPSFPTFTTSASKFVHLKPNERGDSENGNSSDGDSEGMEECEANDSGHCTVKGNTESSQIDSTKDGLPAGFTQERLAALRWGMNAANGELNSESNKSDQEEDEEQSDTEVVDEEEEEDEEQADTEV